MSAYDELSDEMVELLRQEVLKSYRAYNYNFDDICIGAKIAMDKLNAENAGLQTGYKAYEQVNAGLRAEVGRLRESLSEAADEIESWGAYASEYFQQKHSLDGTVSRIRGSAMGKVEHP
jgi:hypothetical protein